MQQQAAELEAVQEREESERQALLLLQRLQYLKTWQSQQEARLLGEHRQEVISLTGDESDDDIDLSRDDTTISSMDSHEEELHMHRDQEDFHRDFKENEDFFDPGGFRKSADLEGVIEEKERPLSPDNPEDQVVGSGGPGRTFEQLLAQQLGDHQGGVDQQALQGDVDQKNQ